MRSRNSAFGKKTKTKQTLLSLNLTTILFKLVFVFCTSGLSPLILFDLDEFLKGQHIGDLRWTFFGVVKGLPFNFIFEDKKVARW